MAQDQRIRMPSSMGGLVSYFEDYKSKVQLKPGHVVLLVGVVVLIELVLHAQG